MYGVLSCWLVHVKNPKVTPRRISTQFFDSDREVLHTFSMALAKTSPVVVVVVFCLVFRQLRFFGKNVDNLLARIFSAQKKEKYNFPPEVRPRDWHIIVEHV